MSLFLYSKYISAWRQKGRLTWRFPFSQFPFIRKSCTVQSQNIIQNGNRNCCH